MADTITMPKLGFDMQEGTLVRWVRSEGETINKGDVLAEIETDKATVEVESSASGVVRKLLVDQGAIVPIGAPIAIIGGADEKIDAPAAAVLPKAASSPSALPIPTQAAPSTPAVVSGGPIKASPLAKKIARDNQVDLSRVEGTGPSGRIVRRDIEAALAGAPASSAAQATRELPSFAAVAHADETVVPTKLRKAIARRMTDAKASIPHFYVSHEYKMDALMELRKQVNEYLPEGQKTSINDFIVRAAALTLREFPNLNSALQGDKVLRHGAVHVGVAVAVEGGLMTVVCQNADQKPLRQISSEVKAMSGRAREGKVKLEDIEGSTFSISNLGMYEVENFIAIINPPEAAILAVGSAREVPVVENGQVKAGWRMKTTLSVDHRLSDGAEAARFLRALAIYLEEPLRLLV